MARRVTKKQAAVEPTFTVKANLEFEIDGERFKDDYKIHYFALSSIKYRELIDDSQIEDVNDENRNIVAEQLAILVSHIDDIVDVDEETQAETHAPMNVEFFDGLALQNLKAIYVAVNTDINPPKAQPAS